MFDENMSRIKRNQHKKSKWNPFAKPTVNIDPNAPQEIATMQLNCVSGYPKKGLIYISKRADNTYCFIAKNVNPNIRYYLNHFYWNGYNETTKIIKPATSTTKTKHGITRGVVGNMLGGLPGGALGAYTATRETSYNEAKTKTKKRSKNAIMEFTNIQNGQFLRIELGIMAPELMIPNIENTFQIGHEIENQDYYNF